MTFAMKGFSVCGEPQPNVLRVPKILVDVRQAPHAQPERPSRWIVQLGSIARTVWRLQVAFVRPGFGVKERHQLRLLLT